MRIEFKPPTFPQHTIPSGTLPRINESQALWYYYILATKNLVRQKDDIILEGDPDPIFSFHKLYLSICVAYAVDPETCTNLWPAVETEIERLNNIRKLQSWAAGQAGETTLYQSLPDELKFVSKTVIQHRSH